MNSPVNETGFSVFTGIFEQALLVLMAVTGLAMCLSLIRLLLGPTTPDRAVSFDQMGLQAVALILLTAMLLRRSDLVDIAIVTSVLGFLGTFLLARYMEQRNW